MWNLTAYPTRAHYSLLEHQLFALLPQDGSRTNSTQIVYQRLQGGPWDVRHPRSIVSTIMSKLIRKVEANKEPFRICKTEGGGARIVSYWIEPRTEPATRPSSHAGDIRSTLFD